MQWGAVNQAQVKRSPHLKFSFGPPNMALPFEDTPPLFFFSLTSEEISTLLQES